MPNTQEPSKEIFRCLTYHKRDELPLSYDCGKVQKPFTKKGLDLKSRNGEKPYHHISEIVRH